MGFTRLQLFWPVPMPRRGEYTRQGFIMEAIPSEEVRLPLAVKLPNPGWVQQLVTVFLPTITILDIFYTKIFLKTLDFV
jgi:hypothetical protein